MASACRGKDRNGSQCQATLYRCARCGHVGCTKAGCTNRGFRDNSCMKCGSSNKSFA